MIEADLDDPGVAVRLIDFIIKALGGEDELQQNKKIYKKKKKKKPTEHIKPPAKNEVNRKALINAVVSALKKTSPKKVIDKNPTPVKVGHTFEGIVFKESIKDKIEKKVTGNV